MTFRAFSAMFGHCSQSQWAQSLNKRVLFLASGGLSHQPPVPELAKVANKYIHAPWLAPPQELARANIRLDRDYPAPIVEHAGARNRFLAIAAEHFGKGDSG